MRDGSFPISHLSKSLKKFYRMGPIPFFTRPKHLYKITYDTIRPPDGSCTPVHDVCIKSLTSPFSNPEIIFCPCFHTNIPTGVQPPSGDERLSAHRCLFLSVRPAGRAHPANETIVSSAVYYFSVRPPDGSCTPVHDVCIKSLTIPFLMVS